MCLPSEAPCRRLGAREAQLAELDYGIANDELQSVLVAENGSTGGSPITPKEELGARIQERQKYLGLLDARLASEQAEIEYLRQAGKLQKWLQLLNPASRGNAVSLHRPAPGCSRI